MEGNIHGDESGLARGHLSGLKIETIVKRNGQNKYYRNNHKLCKFRIGGELVTDCKHYICLVKPQVYWLTLSLTEDFSVDLSVLGRLGNLSFCAKDIFLVAD